MANVTAYGFVDLEYLFSQRITSEMIPTIQTAIRASYEEHNRNLNAMMNELATRTTEYKLSFALSSGKKMQPLDEHGNPKPTKPVGKYPIAFPIRGVGDAWGDNRISRVKMTVEEANRFTLEALTADAAWLRDQMLATLFTNVEWTFSDEEHDDLTIVPLANGDTITYVRTGGGAPATADHYLAQAAAIADATNPYPTIKSTLSAYPGNNGPYVAYIASDLVATTRALATFEPVRDGAILYGSDQTTANAIVNQDLAGGNSPAIGWGDELLGYVDGVWAIEKKTLPSTYIIAVARGAVEPPLAMREYPEEELQGLFPEFHSPDGNHNEYRSLRYAGFGVRNRVAALVYRIGDAAYAIPTGYDARTLAS
jgi:hypothetical protein